MFIDNVNKMNEILNKVNKKPRKKKQSEIFETKKEVSKKPNYNRRRKRKVEVRARPQGRKNRVRRANLN